MEIEAHNTRDERGASAVEYALLVAGIAAVLALIVFAVGTMASDLLGTPCSELEQVGKSCTP